MRTLHRYLTGQIIASLFMTVAVFTFVLLLGNALKEILPLLVGGQVSFNTVGHAMGLLIPFVWVFALPMGMLTATLLIFGRFSADQELTAVRASGVSLVALVTPIIGLSLVLCALSAWVNMDLGPRCRLAYKDLIFKLRVDLFSTAQLPEGRFIRDFPGYIFYVGKNREGSLEDVIVFRLENETNVLQTWRAPRGSFAVDAPNQLISLSLFNGRVVTLGEDRSAGIMSFEELPIELEMGSQKSRKAKLSEMTFWQLREELEQIENQLTLAVPLEGLEQDQLQEVREEFRKQREDVASPIRFQMHRQVAFSFACFGFTLLGIPLGIRVHRRETNVGIAIALILVAIYYSLILLASAMDDKPELAPHVLVWLPNFLFQGAGAVLLWKANHRG